MLGKERSLPLKLFRRMVITHLHSRHGRVTISGRVVPPLARRPQPIVVKRQISCRHSVVVGRIMPGADGRFRVTLDGPPRERAATYRLQTRLPKHARSPKLYPTFTLPRSIELR